MCVSDVVTAAFSFFHVIQAKCDQNDLYLDIFFIYFCGWQNREESGKKGHHNKEEHEGEYDEKSGHKKKHYDDSG